MIILSYLDIRHEGGIHFVQIPTTLLWSFTYKPVALYSFYHDSLLHKPVKQHAA